MQTLWRRGNDKILGSAQIKISDVLAAGGMKLLGTNDGPGLLNSFETMGPPRHFGTTLSYHARWRDNRRLALKHATGRTAIFSRRIADSPAVEVLVILVAVSAKGERGWLRSNVLSLQGKCLADVEVSIQGLRTSVAAACSRDARLSQVGDPEVVKR